MLAWQFFRATCQLVLMMAVAGIMLVAIFFGLALAAVWLVCAGVAELFRRKPPASTVRP